TGASAVVFQSSFHPEFGPDFPNLSFSGLANVFVDQSCLDAGTGQIFTLTGACSTTHFLDGTVSVTLFDTNDSSITETINFPQPTVLAPPPPTNPNPIQDVVIDQFVVIGNQLVAYDTWMFGDVLAAALPADGSVFPGGTIWLRFVSNYHQDLLAPSGFT